MNLNNLYLKLKNAVAKSLIILKTLLNKLPRKYKPLNMTKINKLLKGKILCKNYGGKIFKNSWNICPTSTLKTNTKLIKRINHSLNRS